MKRIKFFLSIAILAMTFAANAQFGFVSTNPYGLNGTLTNGKFNASATGLTGSVQISNASALSAVTGFYYNYLTARLYVDSVPITNQNNFVLVDTTVTDTVRLVFGQTNIITTVGAVRTVVLILPSPPANILSLTGNQADALVTKVKWVSQVNVANYIAYPTDASYRTVYSTVAELPSSTKQFFFSTAAAKYY